MAVPISNRPPGQVVQHADFLHHAGWMVVGQYDSHDAKAQSIRSRPSAAISRLGEGEYERPKRCSQKNMPSKPSASS